MNLPEKKAYCPMCDGYGFNGTDKVGKPYACYFCGMTGYVPDGLVRQIERDERWASYVRAENAIDLRIAYGIPHGIDWYVDQETGDPVILLGRAFSLEANCSASIDEDLTI